MQNTENLKLSSVDTLNYGVDQLVAAHGSSNFFSYNSGDIEVDRDDTETFSSIPRDIRLICQPDENIISRKCIFQLTHWLETANRRSLLTQSV